jgi:Zn-finger nucleic acid-binding protein
MRSQDEVAAMQCPVCRVPLAMSDRQGIEIDYCPQCRGVWLDRGELDKIIERSGPAQQAPAAPPPPRQQQPAPSYQEPRYDQGYGGKPYKKRKHWLSDLFDD